MLDYQTGIVGLIEDNITKFYQIQNKRELKFDFPPKSQLKDAWVAISLEKKSERKNISPAAEIIKTAERISVCSGHIFWLRLAIGTIDAYLDPFGGEKLYEMFAACLAQKAGCIVTDMKGIEFDSSEYLKIFEKKSDFVYFPIAARNKKLHQQALDSIR